MPTEIALEIVPRNKEHILSELNTASQYSQLTALNFPDLLRFNTRSWDACAYATSATKDLIPHLRASDFDTTKPFPLADTFRKLNLKRVLIIQGDPSKDPSHPTYPTTTIDLIKHLRAELPHLKLYAAFDPYRNNIRYEIEYLQQKIEAGASGFFSQPFFDLRLLDIYAEFLEDQDIFWGITPITEDSSRRYWEQRNRAIFPKRFQPTLDWNIEFGHRVLEYCRRHHFNLYLMPIKTNLKDYLSRLF